MAAKAHLIHDAREAGRGRGQEAPEDLPSPARLYLLKLPGLPPIAGVSLPVMSLFISELERALF